MSFRKAANLFSRRAAKAAAIVAPLAFGAVSAAHAAQTNVDYSKIVGGCVVSADDNTIVWVTGNPKNPDQQDKYAVTAYGDHFASIKAELHNAAGDLVYVRARFSGQANSSINPISDFMGLHVDPLWYPGTGTGGMTTTDILTPGGKYPIRDAVWKTISARYVLSQRPAVYCGWRNIPGNYHR